MRKMRQGVTLVELIIVIALIGIVIQVTYSIFFLSNTSYSISTNKGFTQQDVRLVGDFITSELKYVTDMTTDYSKVKETYKNYYSLEVENNSNDITLVKKSYKYNINDTPDETDDYTEIIVREIVGKWNDLNITNNSEGWINVNISQIEGSGNKEVKYELPLNIYLVNNSTLNSEIDNLNLMDDGVILYYQKADDLYAQSKIDIVVAPPESVGDNSGGSDEYLFFNEDSIKVGTTNKNNDIYAVGNNNNFTIEISFNYSGNISNLESTAFGLNVTKNLPLIENNKVKVSDTSRNGNWSHYMITLQIKEKDGDKTDSIEILIGK